jgi:hypothetical protein
MIDKSLNYGRHLVKKFLKQSIPYTKVLDVGAGGGTDLSITKEVNPNCSLNALECFNPNITSLESKGISVNNINIENNLFSSMSWGIYLLLEKVKVYQNDFVEFPKNENLEINFYAG